MASLVATLCDRWLLVRPEVPLAVEVEPGAAPAGRDGENLLLRVEDRGPGIPEDIAASFGKRYVSRKEGGLGLGVLLGSVTIERLGGEVTLLERPGGGTRLEIRLPPAQMAAS